MIDITILKNKMRNLENDHDPDDCPAVQMRDITMLCDCIDKLVPSLDLLERELSSGGRITIWATKNGTHFYLLDKNHKTVVRGGDIKSMLLNLSFKSVA